MDKDNQVVAPIVDGMRITTSDSVANVEVRAKSIGPGFCAVEYSTFGGKVGFDAPPLTFSGWTVLVSHLGKADFTISERVICDTGVLGEVRYFKG
jgi:hypothetical protein